MIDTRDLDREWAEVSGWRVVEFLMPMWNSDEGEGWYWQTVHQATHRDGRTKPREFYGYRFSAVSSNAAACFGPDGPWEWMKSEGLSPALYVEDDGSGCRAVSCSHDGKFIEAYGATEYEAITECAIKVRKRLEDNRDA